MGLWSSEAGVKISMFLLFLLSYSLLFLSATRISARHPIIFNGAYKLWNVDLVLSGHTHGGLIRLPFVGGMYAPMQGWFPEYDRGYFRLGEHMQMVISAGLAGHGIIPRINNPPEIVVIDLVPESAAER